MTVYYKSKSIRTEMRNFLSLSTMFLFLITQPYFSFGTEPKAFHFGQCTIAYTYSKFLAMNEMPLDIEQPPIYIATFNREFSDFVRETKPRHGLSSMRIAIATRLDGIPHFLHLLYTIEFCPEKINNLPKAIRDALAKLYPGIDLRSGLFAGLKEQGVIDIFITSCAFFGGPEFSGPELSSDYKIMPFGFLGLQPEYVHPTSTTYRSQLFIMEDYIPYKGVFIGLFGANGIKPSHDNPLTENILVYENLYYKPNDSNSRTLGFTLCSDNNFQTCYIVAVTADKKRILVTDVLITNKRSKTYEFAEAFRHSTKSFTALLRQLELYALTHNSGDREVLGHNDHSIATLSGNLYEMYGSDRFSSQEFIEVKENATYLLTGEFQMLGISTNLLSFGLELCDEEKRPISTYSINCIDGTKTKLVSSCIPTDTVVSVEDASKWELTPNRCIAFDTVDSERCGDTQNFNIVSCCINKIEKCDHFWKIYLSKEIGKNYSANTKISEHIREERYLHYLKKASTIPKTWTKYSGYIEGSQIHSKAKYIRYFILSDSTTPKSILQFKNVELK